MQRSFSEDMLAAKLDIYNGVTIYKDQLPDSKEKFAQALNNSLKKWKEVSFVMHKYAYSPVGKKKRRLVKHRS